MIDYFTLALTHWLIAVALWRLVQRADLDADLPVPPASAPSRPDSRDA